MLGFAVATSHTEKKKSGQESRVYVVFGNIKNNNTIIIMKNIQFYLVLNNYK